MKLWLLRHAQPSIEPGLCYGSSDVPADAALTLQAAQAFEAALPRAVEVRSSPLSRCSQLAAHLQALRPGLAVHHDARLRELDFGRWELQPWDTLGAAALDGWSADFGRHAPGGGESVQALMERVGQALEEARACPTDVAWITHAGVIRATTLLLAGVRQVTAASQWPSQALPFGEWQVLDLQGG